MSKFYKHLKTVIVLGFLLFISAVLIGALMLYFLSNLGKSIEIAFQFVDISLVLFGFSMVSGILGKERPKKIRNKLSRSLFVSGFNFLLAAIFYICYIILSLGITYFGITRTLILYFISFASSGFFLSGLINTTFNFYRYAKLIDSDIKYEFDESVKYLLKGLHKSITVKRTW